MNNSVIEKTGDADIAESDKSNKGWKALPLFFFLYFIVVGSFQLMGYMVTGVDLTDMDYGMNSWESAVIGFFSLAGTLLLVWFYVDKIFKESFVSLGLSIKNRAKDILAGLLIGFLIMAVSSMLLLALGEIELNSILFEPEAFTLLFLTLVFVAVSEEILCRGFVLGNLMISLNKYTALIISALLFSLLHFFNPSFSGISFFNIFLAGILLGLPYIYTHNLWLPISLHFSWNFFQALFGFHVSGLELYSLFQISIPENTLLNGGEFGFEGSVLCSIMLLLLIAGFLFYYKEKEKKAAL